ncbi:unnamed protein product [Heligmosomoides polygyrus]|uniref:Uncharacterized protein n=1 Tax=Heligmosomoides polygyrus TaxID=6339 RepID=A0A183GKQ9_HELPZ|nr:unnamed protein product [Heligmosomoides polygyrus]
MDGLLACAGNPNEEHSSGEPSSFRERQIGLNCGGPRAYDEERQVATLAEMNSEYYFGPVGELCVVES